jgi:predicted CxxxxCH...CXXCH cytochrome family protein
MRRISIVVLALGLGACLSDDTGTGTIDDRPPNADVQAGCAINCHGTEVSNAPPKSLSGVVETTAIGVGAHRAHVGVAATWHRQVQCADCHVVPKEIGSPGHIDGDNKAELTFGMIAGPSSTWNGTNCVTACHGSAALGGARPNPVWTKVDGTQVTCGSCHGAPPPAPHPADTNCSSCHPTMEVGSLTFRDPARHINGKIDFVDAGATGGCTSCHGSATGAAPPRDLSGDTLPTAGGVGAHAAHLAASNWRRAMPCTSCHVVPSTRDTVGHIDGDNISELKFDTLNPTAVYTRGTTTCSNMYCHGNGRGSTGVKSWVTPGKLGCTSCHSIDGNNMSGEHRKHIQGEGIRCSQCHSEVINAAQTIINANLHVNGLHEIKMANGTFNPVTRACSNSGCHGTERW